MTNALYLPEVHDYRSESSKAPIVQLSSVRLHQGEMRLDAGFHASDGERAQRLLEQCGYDLQELGNLSSTIWYPGRFKRIYANRDHGKPFLTASKMLMFRPESETYLAYQSSQVKKCSVEEGVVLITRSGTVGRCVLVGERLASFAISDDALRLQPTAVPTGYIYAYLTSWIGQALLTKNKYGSAIKHLEPQHAAGVPVPLLSDLDMQEIAKRVVYAYSLREKANKLIDKATSALYHELDLPVFDERLVRYLGPEPSQSVEPLRSFSVASNTISERLDASFHIPVARSAIAIMEPGRYRLVKMESLCSRIFHPSRFKRNYVGEQYGVPFLQGSHLPLMKPHNLKYLARSEKEKVNRCKISSGWVLVTRSGSVGRVSIVSDLAEGWAASEHLIRLIAKEAKCHPGYIALFLMSPYGQHQLASLVYGAVVDELTPEDVALILIPDAPRKVQDALGDPVIQAFKYKDQATISEHKIVSDLERKLQRRSGNS